MNQTSDLVKINDLTPRQIAGICDHTFLNRSEAYRALAKSGESPIKLREVAFRNFLDGTVAREDILPYAVCVRPEDVERTKVFLESRSLYSEFKIGKNIVIASVVGFPDGSAYNTDLKVAEAKFAMDYGAQEIDMVMNYGLFKMGYYDRVREEGFKLVNVVHDRGELLKLILETSELSSKQIEIACEIALEIGVDFVKTSTGFSAYGARVEDLAIMKANFSGGIKMSGGVTANNVKELLYAVSGRQDGYIELNPLKVRIGESSLLSKL